MEGTAVLERPLLRNKARASSVAETAAETEAADSYETTRNTGRKGSFSLEDVSIAYSGEVAVANIDCTIESGKVTSLIGPSGCGKSTLLRCFNRMNDQLGNVEVKGTITLDGENIYDKHVDPVLLRARVGQVFQHPNPFPLSIYDNIAYGPRLHGMRDRSRLDDIVETCLKKAALFGEVEDDLGKSALELSGGQQQRLCIARALATNPEVLLMDEPCSALDPISTSQVEETIDQLKGSVTLIVVTHNMQQAVRISDNTMFMLRESTTHPATLIEWGPTARIFSNPSDERTEAYISGRFG